MGGGTVDAELQAVLVEAADKQVSQFKGRMLKGKINAVSCTPMKV